MIDAAGSTRVGVLGGTLDPIHVGHVETALAARRALGLQAVVVMPARVPPHREHRPSASMFHRFAMAALAVNGLPGLTVSDEELCTDGPSYTATTLERLHARGVDAGRIFFITGADAFAEIESWFRYPAVLDMAHFVVISRPSVPAGSLAARLPHLRDRLRTAADTGEASTPSIFLVDAPTPDVSSTGIRRRLWQGESISGLVPPLVEQHIRQHQLYARGTAGEHLR
jgi:nicotinate-nucleotide adenylyltransferase